MRARSILPYVASIGLVFLTTLLGEAIKKSLEPTNLVMFYLLAVVISAVRWGRGPAIMASILGVLAFDFFLVPPYLTFNVTSIHYVFTFLGLLVVGLVIGTFASRMRERTIEARQREARTAALYRLSSDLARADTPEAALAAVRRNVGEILGGDVAIYLPREGALRAVSADGGFPLGESETERARRAFETGGPLQSGDELPGRRRIRYVPLNTPEGTLGVLGISLRESDGAFERSEEQLLGALASQAALAVQRAKLAEEARQFELMRQTQKLQAALLSSISHDLRTPLASITGTLATLMDRGAALDSSGRDELLRTARGETDRLNRLVGNLLDMTRVEAKALGISKRPSDLRDAIGAALEQLRASIGERTVRIAIPQDFPEVPMDLPFMMKVFTNLIDNALKYSPAGSPIDIGARLSGNAAAIEIRDRGAGIPAGDFERVFEKFYRSTRPSRASGMGLGLSICKGIVEAHGGSIAARNNDDGGAAFTVSLPLD